MHINYRHILKNFIPPIITENYLRLLGEGIYFSGNYPDWETAKQHSKGYQTEEILEKVRKATHAVVLGKAAGERDSVLLTNVPYPFPIISVLLRSATQYNSHLEVIDFGGALGSTYYHCRDFLSHVSRVKWSVVEQLHYVKCGRREFENKELKFYESLDEVVSKSHPQVILASGVLQYLPDPNDVIESFIRTAADYIIIDRTPVSVSGKEIISVQFVPAEINYSSYPLWLFNEEKLKAPLLKTYNEIASYDALDGRLGFGSLKATFKGWIFSR